MRKETTNRNGVAEKEPSRKTDNYTRANFLSKLLFLWMIPTFARGKRKELNLEDLSLSPTSDLSADLTDRLEKSWFEEEEKAAVTGRKPSLRRALIRTFFWDHLPDILLLFSHLMVFKSIMPPIMALILKYWEKDSGVTWSQAMQYAGLLVVVVWVSAIVYHHGNRRAQQFGMRLRVACSSLIYRKITRMDVASLNNAAAGKVVNLLSNDVSRFDQVFLNAVYIWIAPLNVILVSYLMYREVGISGLIGVVVIIVQTVPVQIYMSGMTARLRLLIANATDERVKLMDEIIGGIQVIKMYAWEKPFEKVVMKSRKHEIDLITKTSYLRGIYLSFMVFTERFTLYCTLLTYTLLGQRITAAVVFPLAQFFNLLQYTLAYVLPNAISFLAELLVSIDRLNDFLLLGERSDLAIKSRTQYINSSKSMQDTNGQIIMNSSNETVTAPHNVMSIVDITKEVDNFGFEDTEGQFEVNSGQNIIELEKVTADWGGDSTQPALSEVSLKLGRGKLCAVIGSVGSGKSSLLQLLLGELYHQSGEVKINGSLSYASQEPWLFVATVRQNILFGLPYDVTKYKEVVRVCALEKDFQQFPRGDQTLVGERGVSLSGGQRARINLARAVYRQADVYLLDDPLSAVDAAVGRQLFDNCITGYLQEQTRLLVTHQLHYLKAADIIVILNNGKVENVGTFEELTSSGENFAKLLAALQEDQENDNTPNLGDKSLIKRTSMKRQSSKQAGKLPDVNDDQDAEELEQEARESGYQSFSIYSRYWTAGNSWFTITGMVVIMVLGQLSATVSDYWVTYWTDAEFAYKEKQINNSITSINETKFPTMTHKESRNLSTDDAYDIHAKIGQFSPVEYLYIYTVIIISCIALTCVRASIFFKLSMNSSKGLHNQMFHCILRGVMRFFDANPTGRILNRFSKDIGSVDELLPKVVIDLVQIGLVFVSIIVLVSVSNSWLLIPIAVMGAILYYMLIYYLKSAQAIKRIEGVTKSPIYSHITSTLTGIATIRCTNEEKRFIYDFDQFQDTHTSTWNHYIMSSYTLGFWLDCIVSIFLGFVVFLFLLIDESLVSSGECGLAISQSLILTGMLQYGVRQGAEVISQMTSVERVLQYTKIETEKGLEEGARETPSDWPSNGAVSMRGASMRYGDDKPIVLNNLNIDIQPGWKVGIVGRTGAGKTSLITALFRLAKVEGLLEIDGIDTGDIALQDLRSRISIIPQEPVLFSATMRYNLDPFNKYDDASLWQALEDVELREAVPNLEYMVTQGGSNFSLGQRQLICLARAILKNNKILILDEATANVDPQTDTFIQRTIRERFAACTVLTIAHRLNTVMDSDRVLVMNFGKAVEFDHPYILLKNANGYLHSMVKETGPKMTKQLFEVAKDTYQSNGGSVDSLEDSLKEE